MHLDCVVTTWFMILYVKDVCKSVSGLPGVSRMFRAFATADIPEGLAKAYPNYEVYEQTLRTGVMCAESGIYYFSPAQNRRISAVRLLTQGKEAVF